MKKYIQTVKCIKEYGKLQRMILKGFKFQAGIDSHGKLKLKHIIQTNHNLETIEKIGDDCICSHFTAKCIIQMDAR